jgi:hypothetical protein
MTLRIVLMIIVHLNVDPQDHRERMVKKGNEALVEDVGKEVL